MHSLVGVSWHANLQLKQNMITQGDMPRFILDSYEECRGPPQLFTLDKYADASCMKIYNEHVFCNYTHWLFRFDVAGAGASLKRYSDPSFFKTESNMLEMDVSIENKPRRVKVSKKGSTLAKILIFTWKLGQNCFSLCPANLVSLPTRLCYIVMRKGTCEASCYSSVLKVESSGSAYHGTYIGLKFFFSASLNWLILLM